MNEDYKENFDSYEQQLKDRKKHYNSIAIKAFLIFLGIVIINSILFISFGIKNNTIYNSLINLSIANLFFGTVIAYIFKMIINCYEDQEKY